MFENKGNETVERLKGIQKDQQAILDAVPAWIFFKDKENRFVQINKRFAEIMGLPAAKLIGKSLFDLYPKEQAEKYWRDDKEVMNSGRAKINIVEPVKIKNDTFWVKTDKIPFRDEKGNIAGVIGFTIDITDQIKAEEKIKQSEQKYRALFDSSQDAIMTLEPPTWKFTSGNLAALKLFGAKSEKEFLAVSPDQVSPPAQPDGQPSGAKAKAMIEKAMQEGSNFFEWTHKKIRGKNFPATVLLSRVVIGEKTFLQATVRDITQQKEVEKKLAEKINDLERMNRLMVGRELEMVKLKKEIAALKK